MFQELINTLELEKTSLAAQASKIKMEKKLNEKTINEYKRLLAELKYVNRMAAD